MLNEISTILFGCSAWTRRAAATLVGVFAVLVAVHCLAASGGFTDDQGNNLSQFEPAWKAIELFYKESTPLHIRVIERDFADGTSKFNCHNETIFIHPQHFKKNAAGILAHEASHLALCRLTAQANILVPFRFIDEGFADIIEFDIVGKADRHKTSALRRAAEQYELGNVSFQKVQNWRAYSRDAMGRFTPYAYQVGSSFVYFLIDSYSKEKLRDFFVSLGRHRDLAPALTEVFGLSLQETEKRWLGYLDTFSPERGTK
jgi:stage V sporulation protein SpoVS